MGLKAFVAKIFAARVAKKIYADANRAVEIQEQMLLRLVQEAKNTQFGSDHSFNKIQSRSDFISAVPIRDYEGLKDYIALIKEGKNDILWPGKPLYLSKTSGTTSGAKYIPITNASMPEHIKAARNALLMYIFHSGKADFVNGKMIFLQGSPVLDSTGGIKTGRLSGIVAHHVPGYLQKNRMPSYKVNCIEDWETKVKSIVSETRKEKMTLISGIPAWVQMYFEKLLEATKADSVSEVFPDFSLMVYGGVNFSPYKNRFRELLGKHIDSVELFPASEGFFAFQDLRDSDGMLLNVNAGMYYEFIPAEELDKPRPKTLSLSEVALDTNYALLITSNAGLWRYNIGDLVRFVSLNPFRIRVSGRTKHYTSAFGEHVIAEEVEFAMTKACEASAAVVNEFSLAPQINPEEGLPYHEWFVEFTQEPADWDAFILCLDNVLQSRNPYYKDLLDGKVLDRLRITCIQPHGFNTLMKEKGKLGGQNKIPRLANNRDFVCGLSHLSDKTVALSKNYNHS